VQGKKETFSPGHLCKRNSVYIQILPLSLLASEIQRFIYWRTDGRTDGSLWKSVIIRGVFAAPRKQLFRLKFPSPFYEIEDAAVEWTL